MCAGKNAVTLIFSRYLVLNMTMLWHSCNLPSLTSWSCSKPHSAIHLYCFPLSNFFHALKPALMPKLCCCVPAYQKTCRPVQERDREEERKREGSQLRLGNGRVNVREIVCVCMGECLTSSGCECTCSCMCVCMCVVPQAVHIAKLNLAGPGF